MTINRKIIGAEYPPSNFIRDLEAYPIDETSICSVIIFLQPKLRKTYRFNMSGITTLLSRKSHNRLGGSPPTKSQVETMMKAALRAPDHAGLKPSRYQVYQGESLKRLGRYFVEAARAQTPDISDTKIEKIDNKPLRAPMVIAAIVNITEHKKVPEIEQILSAGAGVQNLLMAAHFMNIGSIWRTGDLAFNSTLMTRLGLAENEKIVGFVYLGEEQGDKKNLPQIDTENFVEWK